MNPVWKIAAVRGSTAGLPTHFDESIESFTAQGRNGWIIGWHPNTFDQVRIKVMRYRHERDRWPDIVREC